MLSVILLSYFSGSKITQVYLKTKKILDEEGIEFEFVIMDDGSSDDSYNVAQLLERSEKNVRAYQLSRNFTSDYSMLAGYSVVKGDCAVYIVDDGQPDESFIVPLYREWEKGSKINFLIRANRNDPFFSKILSTTFYSIMNRLADVKYPPGGVEIALIDREIIDILNKQIHPINTAVPPELLRLGFDPVFIHYDRPKSSREKSRWTFKKKLRMAKNIFFSSSSLPIRVISYLGITFSIFSFLLLVLYSYIRIFGNKDFWGYPVPGWTSLILLIAFFSGLILFSLGVIAEYILRIYDEVKARPGFIIKRKEESGK